jgi:hypothetical protein
VTNTLAEYVTAPMRMEKKFSEDKAFWGCQSFVTNKSLIREKSLLEILPTFYLIKLFNPSLMFVTKA